MPQPKKAGRFGGTAAHHNLILSSLATELIRHGRIRTTLAKAKNVQPVAERMITFARQGDVHARRQVLKVIRDKDVVHKLFVDVGPAFADRNGGYTRVLKLSPRKGDNAPMALIELVEGVSGDDHGELEEAPRRRWSLRRRRGTQKTTARERAEDRAAAADRGEERERPVEPEAAEAVPAGALDKDETADQARPEAPGVAEADDEDEGPQVDPAEVERRLAAAEDEDAEASDEDTEPEASAEEPEASAEDVDDSDEDDTKS